MRLLFSVAVLVILACVVLEASAGKSNRNTDATKGNQKSTNSKEVRYSKNKSDYKRKANDKAHKVVKEKKQRQRVEGNRKIDSNEVIKETQNDHNKKVSREEQKRQKRSKQTDIGKNGENLKNNKKPVRETKDTMKRQKRSLELERPKENAINDATVSSLKNKDSKLSSTAKKLCTNKLEKKTGTHIKKAFDGEFEGDADVNTEAVSGNPPSEEIASLLDNNIKSSGRNKIEEKQHCNLKKIKQQKHKKIRESPEEKIQTVEEPAELDEKSEYLDDSLRNSYNLNRDSSIEVKNAKSGNTKKQKSSKKNSENTTECERQVNNCKLSNSKSEKYKSGSCCPEAQCLIDHNRTDTEKAKYFSDDSAKSDVVNIEPQEVRDKESTKLHPKVTEKSELEDNNVEVEDCIESELL